MALRTLGKVCIASPVCTPCLCRTQQLEKAPSEVPEGCTVAVVGSDMFHWQASLKGPVCASLTARMLLTHHRRAVHMKAACILSTLSFQQVSKSTAFPPLQLTITSTDYPFRAPTVTFITKIYHPNVDAKGNICMDVFGKTWNPTMNAAKSVLCILP